MLGGWIAALALAFGVVAPLAGTYEADFLTPGSDSAAADKVLQERFPDRSSSTIDVVWHAAAGARSPAVRERVDAVLAKAERLEGVGAATPLEVSRDGQTAIARLQIDAARDSDVPKETGEQLIVLAKDASGQGLQVAMAGWTIAEAQESEVSPEVVGFAIAALVLLLTFGSLLAAGLPLLTAFFGLGIGTTLVGTLAAVTDVPEFAPAIAGMMAIGVGIDYALLVITRYRTGLADGLEPADAAARANATAGRSVLVAGLTVVVALLGLYAMRLPFLNGVALSASLAVLIAVAAAVTLLPAMLGFAGRRIDALRVPFTRARVGNGRPSRWVAYSRAIQRRPWTAVVAGLLAIAALALPLTDFRLGFPDAGNDPEATMTRQAYDLVETGFGPGASGPLLVTAELQRGDGAGASAEGARALALLRERVGELDGIVSSTPPRLNADGDAALLMAIGVGSPQDEATQNIVDRLRDDVVPALERETGMELHVGGATASIVDQSEYTLARLPLFIGAVVVAVVPAAARRVPLAAGGAEGRRHEPAVDRRRVRGRRARRRRRLGGQLVGIDTATPVPPFIPVMMFAILFGLSMDYEVFLLSRIREEFERHGDNSRAVTDGLAKTARVITAAAAIMIAVFSSFAIADDVILKLMGIGMATAILIDATIVRMVLVPAIMQILGRANWWLPRWIEGLLPSARPLPRVVPAAD